MTPSTSPSSVRWAMAVFSSSMKKLSPASDGPATGCCGGDPDADAAWLDDVPGSLSSPSSLLLELSQHWRRRARCATDLDGEAGGRGEAGGGLIQSPTTLRRTPRSATTTTAEIERQARRTGCRDGFKGVHARASGKLAADGVRCWFGFVLVVVLVVVVDGKRSLGLGVQDEFVLRGRRRRGGRGANWTDVGWENKAESEIRIVPTWKLLPRRRAFLFRSLFLPLRQLFLFRSTLYTRESSTTRSRSSSHRRFGCAPLAEKQLTEASAGRSASDSFLAADLPPVPRIS